MLIVFCNWFLTLSRYQATGLDISFLLRSQLVATVNGGSPPAITIGVGLSRRGPSCEGLASTGGQSATPRGPPAMKVRRIPVADGSEQTAQLTSESHATQPAQSQSRADTIVTAIAHEFRIAMPSNTSIPAATKSRPTWGVRSISRPPVTMRVYAANGRRT